MKEFIITLFSAMDDDEYIEDIEDENYDEFEEANDYEVDDEEYDNVELITKHSSENKAHYLICSSDRVLLQINEEIKQVMNLAFLDYNWAFLLYYLSHWNKDIVYKLMDADSTHHKIISFLPNYQVQQTQQLQCQVCLCDMPLYNNSCGHKFCIQCWQYNLETSVFVNSELFPHCQAENCQSLMNYKLIQLIINNPKNLKIKQKFQHLLFVLYSRQNSSTKICPFFKCGRQFLITDLRVKPIWCQCRSAVCTFCGSPYHLPLHCAELQNWNKMVQDNENTWIQIVQYKVCPKCKDPIEKNQGCNHMTCRCKHQFCWICLSDWKTHGVCLGRDAHDRMEEQRKKLLSDEGKYREKFQNCKADAGRYQDIIKRVASNNVEETRHYLMEQTQIPTQKTDFLNDIDSLVSVGFRFCQYCKIYEFFRDEISLQGFHAKTVHQYCDELDNYMIGLLEDIGRLKRQISDYDPNPKKIQTYKEKIKDRIYNGKGQIAQVLSKANEFIMKLIEEQ